MFSKHEPAVNPKLVNSHSRAMCAAAAYGLRPRSKAASTWREGIGSHQDLHDGASTARIGSFRRCFESSSATDSIFVGDAPRKPTLSAARIQAPSIHSARICAVAPLCVSSDNSIPWRAPMRIVARGRVALCAVAPAFAAVLALKRDPGYCFCTGPPFHASPHATTSIQRCSRPTANDTRAGVQVVRQKRRHWKLSKDGFCSPGKAPMPIATTESRRANNAGEERNDSVRHLRSEGFKDRQFRVLPTTHPAMCGRPGPRSSVLRPRADWPGPSICSRPRAHGARDRAYEAADQALPKPRSRGSPRGGPPRAEAAGSAPRIPAAATRNAGRAAGSETAAIGPG